MGDLTAIAGTPAGAAKQQSAAIVRLRRLLLVVLAVAIVTFTTGVFVLVQRIFDNFGPGVREDLAWKTIRGAQELAHSADLGLAIHDRALVERAFGDYVKSEDVVAIVAQDADGQVIAAHRAVPRGLQPFEGPALNLIETSSYLRTWAPATIEGNTVGRVALVVSKHRLIQSQRLLHRISLANGVAGGLALLCGIFFVVLFTRAIAHRGRQLAEYDSDLERRILERTAELDRINRGMRLVLDNVQQGLITVSLDGTMSRERSAIVDLWLGTAPADARLSDVIRPHDAEAAEWLELGLEALRD